MKQIIDHPTESELNLWLDGELSPVRAEALKRHLLGCPDCCSRRAEVERVIRLAREAAPEASECCSEGAFWVRLASHLQEEPDKTTAPVQYPWLRLVPTFALAALGGLLDVLLTAVLIAYSLINLGLLPNLGSQLFTRLQETLPSSGLVAFLARLGIADAASLQSWLGGLTSGGLSGNEVALYTLLIVLSVVMALVVAMLLLWNVPRIADEQNLRRVNANAVR
ncbi:MAG: anti-sigma factor [Anaerolineae bacterium]